MKLGRSRGASGGVVAGELGDQAGPVAGERCDERGRDRPVVRGERVRNSGDEAEGVGALDVDAGFIRLARAVYFENDIRARIKKDINLALGSSYVEEKSYQDYGTGQGA